MMMMTSPQLAQLLYIPEVLMYAEERYKDKHLRVVWILLHLCIKSTRSHGVFSFFKYINCVYDIISSK